MSEHPLKIHRNSRESRELRCSRCALASLRDFANFSAAANFALLRLHHHIGGWPRKMYFPRIVDYILASSTTFAEKFIPGIGS